MTDLHDFIADVERRMFRTNQDTGANSNALMIWNQVRKHAGLPRLTHDDLRQRHVDSSPSAGSVEELKAYEAWYRDYSVWRDFPAMERRYRELEAAGGWDALVDRSKYKA